MDLIPHYLLLKIKLAYRGLGDHRQALSVVIAILLSLGIYGILTSDKITLLYALMGMGLVILSVLQYHFKRDDLDFLLSQTQSIYPILVAEYMMMILPFVTLLWLKQIWISGVFLLAPFIIPLLPSRVLRSNNTLSFLGSGNVEWNAGLRNIGMFQWLFLLSYIVSCIFISNEILSLILMAIIHLSFSNYYSIHEDENMIISYHNGKELLSSKLYFLLKYLSLVSIILSFIFFISYMKFNWVVLMIIGQSFTINITALLIKYSYYPNKVAGELQLSILLILAVIPYTAPLVLLLNIALYKKARSRLNPYFPYDNH